MTRRKSTCGAKVDAATRYAEDVVDGRVVAGRPVRLACERHLRDLENGPKRGLYWDVEEANRVLGFFREVLRLSGGDSEGKPFAPEPSQAFILGSLFGWKGRDGYRRFRTAYIEIGKGNGKSPLAAGIGTYMMVADGEPRAEVYSAAVHKEQAKILFDDAVAMVDQSPALSARITRSGGAGRVWNLADLETASFFRPISSEHRGRGKSGPRVHCALLDEVHEHPTNAMVEFMRAGTKGRRQALIIMITNSGFDRQSVCWHYHDYGIRMLRGGDENNDALFPYICSLDSCEGCWSQGYVQPNPDCSACDDWRDPDVWLKANPLLGVSITQKYLAEQVRDAIGMPSKQGVVRRLNFCEWTESATPFISAEVWRASGAPAEFDAFCENPVAAGLDLSAKNDLTALVLVCEDKNGSIHVDPWFWTPRDGLREREERDRAPYSLWVEQEHLIAKPGRTIDYAWVAREIGEIHAETPIQEMRFDRWRIDDLKRELDAQGVDAWVEGADDPIPGGIRLVPHGQGYKDMTPAVEALEDAVKEARLRHGNHPVLTMCVANAVTVEDASGCRKFAKDKATGRIDGAVALSMALCALARKSGEEPESVYAHPETAVM